MNGLFRSALAVLMVALVVLAGARAKAAVVGPNCKKGTCVLYSPNISLYYKPGETKENLAREIIQIIENIRAIYYQNKGFRELAWLKNNKLPVVITPLKNAWGIARTDKTSGRATLYLNTFSAMEAWSMNTVASNILAGKKISANDINDITQTLFLSTVAHEFFHLVQHAYSFDERSWLYETTATSAEYIFLPRIKSLKEAYYGYRGYWNSLVRNVRSWYPVTADKRQNAYAMSAFFSYLAEHTSDQAGFLKKLWERARAKTGDNTYDALAHVVGDAKPWGEKLQQRVVEFAAAFFLRDPDIAPYALRYFRKKGIEKAFTMRTVDAVAYAGYENGKLALEHRFARDYSFDYERLILARDKGGYGGRFALAVRGLTGRQWAFRILHNKAGQKSWEVLKVPAAENGWSILETQGADAGDRFVVSTVNLRPNPRGSTTVVRENYAVVGVMTSPLILEKIEAYQAPGAGARPVWRIRRLPEASTRRGATWRTQIDIDDGFTISGDAGQPLDGRLVLRFNRPVFTLDQAPRVQVTLGEQSLVVAPSATGDGREVVARIDLQALSRLLDNKKSVKLPIKVEAYDLWRAGLDGDPATPVHLVVRGKRALALDGWEGQGADAKAPGGIDRLGGALITLRGRPAPKVAGDPTLAQGLTGCWTTSVAPAGEVRIYSAGKSGQVIADITYPYDRPPEGVEIAGGKVTLRYTGTFSWPVLTLRHQFKDPAIIPVFGNYSTSDLMKELIDAGISSTYSLRFQPVSKQQADEMSDNMVFEMIRNGQRGLWQLSGTWWPNTHWHVPDPDAENGFRVVKQSEAPEDQYGAWKKAQDYWQPTNERWLSDLASVKVMTPDFTKPLKRVAQGQRIGIRATVRTQCDLMLERLKIDVEPVNFAYGETKKLTLFETTPASGVFQTPPEGVLVDFDYPYDMKEYEDRIVIRVDGRFYNNDSEDQPSVTLDYQPPRK
jgi:hypothetical protein